MCQILCYYFIGLQETGFEQRRAVSQIIKKLEAQNLVYRKKSQENGKLQCLYVTEKGARLNQAHQRYDMNMYQKIMEEDLLKNGFTRQDLNSTFAVLEKLLANARANVIE